MYKFSPSLMCMDLSRFKEQVEVLNDKADFYHVDIMDGHFVKNITLSPFFIQELKKITDVPIDAHLMVTNPADFVEMTIDAGADYISLHAETINGNAFRLINQIKEKGKKFGVVLNPATPLESIRHYIQHVDKLTIMTVDPGFAGQKFVEEMIGKIKEAKELKERNGYKYLITIDGSCNKNTFKKLVEAGAEVLIVGSSGLFGLDEDVNIAWDKMMDTFHLEVKDISQV
ncbi:allulose-6-phosphate 3-epimerase [Alkalihalobacillus alcalophilus ATCC 27647 = CGMCC 1.3604]|uniref:Putative D-allulose-6-phosphate 3-epimerase n=1 Tax=Alkalihalobacillus alcalophilus ATCC 27647 = CGMCC 1.3604 TaxID=1218173 RepID=A0A094WLM1_ALKAL|nr:D-allulose 6-phosphate 3-epimerase [Alkalihalobacillus alcalophilus]KGA98654.1 allulose-6-phosphate 3-epimerase [Alkalihalobacillus alcalophilus ATCC 27647 = CGMCC 1.3604]MED1562432.1 D-allulose 6-phosphate 3-epimerase [Alkalihalobacillus alcalophilus]THG91168.1 allulose-6-phosphate 3-epimerase [Alkalihalobacillus alcalophilus ATCC 27647 = CGMCC 1.3604]